MKIGILTLPLHVNYGGILQAWALQTVLERMGHEVGVFGRKKSKEKLDWMRPLRYSVRFAKKCLGRPTVPVFTERINRKKHQIHYRSIADFVTTRIHTCKIESLDSISKAEYDCIVVGSDQIWRKRYLKFLWKTEDASQAFLSHLPAKEIKRMAYAASFGIDTWQFTQEETDRIQEAVKHFAAISVREKSAVNLLESYTGRRPTFVLDPTMLLSADDYRRLLNLGNKASGGGIVSYILDANDDTDRLISLVKQHRNLRHTELNAPGPQGSYPGVEEWIRHIAEADIMVTDSFHGCVFSIIFRKPLIFVGNAKRGNTRFDSLIETFGIEGNQVHCIEDFNPKQTYELPEDIHNRIMELSVFSFEFIQNTLGGM